MRVLWAILLGGLAFIGTAKARLGETLEEIEKRVGKLEEASYEEAKFNNPKIRVLRTLNQSGITQTDFMFFKMDDPETAKCVGVSYTKVYSENDRRITLEQAKKIIQENLPTFPLGFSVCHMKNVSDKGWGHSTTGDLWEIGWAIPNGGASVSVVNLESPRTTVIGCLSYRLVWFHAAEKGMSLTDFTDSEKAESGSLPHK